MFAASSILSPFLFYEEQGQRRKEKSDGGEKTLRSLGLAEAELRQPLRRGSTKGLGHFSPVAVPEKR